MSSLILDERDQQFVLNEMLNVNTLCQGMYADFSADMFDMVLREAQKFSQEEIYPILKEGDEEGCRLDNGSVKAPESFKRAYKLYCDAGWIARKNSKEFGGQGFPVIINLACDDWFFHNFAFNQYSGLTSGVAELIELYGSEEQKRKYLPKMLSGEWGGTMCLTESNAGTDLGLMTTKAERRNDGSFNVQGTKIFISCGDHDLVENIVHAVLARIEGAPEGIRGISLFLIPKYIVNSDGSLGKRNDYQISKIEDKMGLHGGPTCMMNFGDNSDCYAELLGDECAGVRLMFNMVNTSRMSVGVQGLTAASFCYLHSLQYAKERFQGTDSSGINPGKIVPIINHPDIRRMLLWMKSQVESMRALIYYTGFCHDRSKVLADEKEREKWGGLVELLVPICKGYSTDVAFRVCEMAIQIYGGYGYCKEYPVEQLLRDEKIASIYEGTNGIQSLDLIGRKLSMKKGANFVNLIGEMNDTISKYKDSLGDLADSVQVSVKALVETVKYFGECGKAGKSVIPLNNSYPFLMMMGKIVSAWLLLWEAGIAADKLKGMGVTLDLSAMKPLAKNDSGIAFYAGKIASAKYFIRNVLPEYEGTIKAIKSEDMSIMDIADESFAS